MAKSLIFKTLSRELATGGLEQLQFQPGLNLIVGPPNSGKTVWLQMLDYLMGDRGQPENAFKADLVDKYVAITADAFVGDDLIRIERRWDQVGRRTKILLNGQPLDADGFTDALLGILEIPTLHFPSGNPYSERSWPRLSWRILLRHIYRQERFWNDIADKQPESEQHAAIALFIGIAERLFPLEWADLIQKRKKLLHLEARKDQFQEMVDQIARDLIAEEDGMQYLTAKSITERIAELERRVVTLLHEREVILERAIPNVGGDNTPEIAVLTSRRAEYVKDLERIIKHKQLLQERVEEVVQLLETVCIEINRLRGVIMAGEVLADLKVTHCPACDQAVTPKTTDDNTCFLCHKSIYPKAANERIDYEVDQLEQERLELEKLQISLKGELEDQKRLEVRVQEQLDIVERDLHPARTAISALVDPDVSRLDSKRGRLEERIRQFRRFANVLEYRESLESQIDELATEVANMEAEVEKLRGEVSFEKASTAIEEGMHNFFNLLNAGIHELKISDSFQWTQRRVSLDLRDRSFRFRIGDQKWSSQIGATSTVHFLLSYHYAILSLTNQSGCHYPGLLIADFPPELLDAETIGDKANYLVNPFIELIRSTAVPLQVIIAGRSFEGIEADHRIKMERVWK